MGYTILCFVGMKGTVCKIQLKVRLISHTFVVLLSIYPFLLPLSFPQNLNSKPKQARYLTQGSLSTYLQAHIPSTITSIAKKPPPPGGKLGT